MDKVLLALVVYNQKFEESKSFTSIVRYNTANNIQSNWVVFDNSSLVPIDTNILVDANTNIHFLSLGYNSGLTKHYNKAFEIAQQKGYEYVLLLDQDSDFSKGLTPYFDALNNTSIPIIVPRMLAENKQLSPSAYFLSRGFISSKLKEGIYSLKKFAPINSGTLIRTDVWKLAGGFNNNIQLDFSDYSFFQRVRKSGVNDFFLIDYDIKHELSAFDKDEPKIITRFKIYISDLKVYQTECSFIHKLALSFWAFIHFVKVLIRTKFNIEVASIYFS